MIVGKAYNSEIILTIPKDIIGVGPFTILLENDMSHQLIKYQYKEDRSLNDYTYEFMISSFGLNNTGQYSLTLIDKDNRTIYQDICTIDLNDPSSEDYEVTPDDWYYEASEEKVMCQGAQGVQGYPGVQGIQGPIGPQGVQGYPGVQGNWGAQGIQGPIGPQGVQGYQGIKGEDGAQGTQGAQGTKGEDGAQGTTGAQGVQGLQGAQGVNGESFPSWFGTKEEYDAIPVKDPEVTYYVQGDIHWFGTQEEYDAITDKDPNMIYFVQGTGGSGAQGAQGIQGLQGPAGADGAQGTQGLQGADGAQGTTGAQGAQGIQGLQGLNGLMEQADWNEQTSTNPSYIQNKPTIPTKTSDLQNDSGFIDATTNRNILGCNIYYFSNTPDANNKLIVSTSGVIQRAIETLGRNMTFGLNSNAIINMLNLKMSFDGGSTFYTVTQSNQSSTDMNWAWYGRQTLYLRVDTLPTENTDGNLQIVMVEDAYIAVGNSSRGSLYRTNVFRSSNTSGYKVIKSGNTANGIISTAIHANNDSLEVIYKPEAYKTTNDGTVVAKIEPQRGKTIDANTSVTRYVPFTDEVFRAIYMNTTQDTSTGNIVLDTHISEFAAGDMFWIYTNRSYGPVDSIHVSFDNGTTYYDFSRFGETTNMGFNIPKYGKLLVQVNTVATANTNGVLRIITCDFSDIEKGGYAGMHSRAVLPNSTTGDYLKMVSSTNTANGRMGIGFHGNSDRIEFIYKPEAYKDTTNGRAVAVMQPQRNKTIGANDALTRYVAFVDEIPSNTETWTFTLADGTTTTKTVYIQ